jgi:hypothetical protein
MVGAKNKRRASKVRARLPMARRSRIADPWRRPSGGAVGGGRLLLSFGTKSGLIPGIQKGWIGMSGNRGGPSFSAGRDQSIAYAERGDATLDVRVANSGATGDVDIIAELRALREILARLTAPDSPSAILLETAETEAKAETPRRDKVAGLVESATKLATSVNGFAEQGEKLIPTLQHIGRWAGRAWDAWGPTLGF